MIRAGTSVMIGARMNSSLSAEAGINSSLKNSLIPSATGCNNPNGPARLGPMRTWILARIRRSSSVR